MCRKKTVLEFFLIHPGGPFWARKNQGAWSMPKGLVEGGEDLLDAARREFLEETGIQSTAPYHPLGSLKTKGGKFLHAWTFSGEWDPATGIVSNRITIEYPYKSGKLIEIPEADRGAWMSFEQASEMINMSQRPMLEMCIPFYR